LPYHEGLYHEGLCQEILGDVTSQPWLVFLHGFLGEPAEWRPLAAQLAQQYPCLLLRLPGHGPSPRPLPRGAGFEWFAGELQTTLNQLAISRYWLIGYSLGGRLAAYCASHQPAGLAGLWLESCHPGLTGEAERRQRWQQDRHTAAALRRQPFDAWLAQWYRQPVFASLSDTQRRQLIGRRLNNQPTALARMLLATSVARQPDLRPWLARTQLPIGYLYGERDRKYAALGGELSRLNPQIRVAGLDAGHNVHFEQPAKYARLLDAFITARN